MPFNKRILLDNRPVGEASLSNFTLVEVETPELQEGQALVRHHYLSLDPYMRGRMNDAKSYAQPQELGKTMGGAPLPMAHPALILRSRLKLQGFIVSEHMEIWHEALKELGTLVAMGKLRPRESVAQGIENAPEAFLGLLKGKNFGKQLVKLI